MQELARVYMYMHVHTQTIQKKCVLELDGVWVGWGVACKDLEVQFWSMGQRAIPSTLHQYEREPVRQGRLHQNKTHYRQAPAIYGPANVIFRFMAEILMFLSWCTLKEKSSFQALSCQDRRGERRWGEGAVNK